MIGFVNIDKPVGMSSAQAVSKVKHITSCKLGGFKVGHFGTLDPLASGVLPVALGKATRLFDYCVNKRKKYTAEFTFGITTDTLDKGGTITQTSTVIPSKSSVLTALKSFCGELDQVPPIYSAKSINGVRAYQLARGGKDISLLPKKVNVFSFDLKEQIAPEVYVFEIECGGGTYIRSLARDLAVSLNTVGYMTALRRTESGCFTLDNSVTLDNLAVDYKSHVLDVSLPLQSLSTYELPERYLQKVLNGVKIELTDMPEGMFRLYCNEKLIGLAQSRNDLLTMECNLYDE